MVVAPGVGVSEKQQKFLLSDKWITGFVAGRGAGKSVIGAMKVLKTAKAGQKIIAAAPTYNMLEDATYAAFEQVARDFGLWIKGRHGSAPRAIFKTQDNGEAQISFRSADNPERLRGPSLPLLWLDEASLMHEDAFKIGIACLRHKGTMGKLLITFTPRGRRHWTFSTFYREIPKDEITDTSRVVEEIGGRYYVRRKGTYLVRSHTKENPFAPPSYFESIRDHYSSALAAQELAGEFVDLEGLVFRAEWFKSADVAPRVGDRVRYWDRAATHGSGKYTAGVLMCRSEEGLYYIEDVKRGRWSAAERDNIMVETAYADASEYGNEVMIYAEQEGGSAGKEISEQFIRRLAGFPVFRDIVSGKRSRMVDNVQLPGEAKVIRAMPLAAQCEAGNVHIIRAPWNEEFLLEMTGFPDYAYSDQVDATSGAFNKLANLGSHDPGEVARPAIEQYTEHFGLALERSKQRRRGL